MGKESTSTRTKTPLILIVDDEISIAETLGEFVTELGYTPLIAYNGQQALTIMREHWPTLVMTDFMMPLLNGAGLIHALHVESETRKKVLPPIILLSAVNKATLADIDVDAIIPKPFDLDYLEQVLKRLLSTTNS